MREGEALLLARRVGHSSQVVGPRHDPYARETWVLSEEWGGLGRRELRYTRCALAGDQLEARYDQGPWLELVPFIGVHQDQEAREVFYTLTGFQLEDAVEAYWRNYVDCPYDGLYYGEA